MLSKSARSSVTALVVLMTALGAAVTSTGASAVASPADDLYNAAQHAFVSGDVPDGLAHIDSLLAGAPGDTDAWELRALFADLAGDHADSSDALATLGSVAPDKRDRVQTVLTAVAAAAATPPTPFPSIMGPQTGVVILGYGLLPDGSMRPELIARLQAGLMQAVAAPFSPIVVTGGNARNGVSEAAAMGRWLRDHGVPAGRVHEEDRAGSTVQNALFSTSMLRDLGVVNSVVVTSADHIRRATADFAVAGLPVVGAMSTTDGLIDQLPPLERSEQLSMYVDASRVAGIPSSR